MSNDTTSKNLFAGKARTVAAVAAFSGLALATTVSVQATQNADEQAPAAAVSEAPASENTVSAEPAAKADKAQEKKAEKAQPAPKAAAPVQSSVVEAAPVANVTPFEAPAATQVVPAAQNVTPVAEQAPAQGRHAAQPTQQTVDAENTARQDAQVFSQHADYTQNTGYTQGTGYQGTQQTTQRTTSQGGQMATASNVTTQSTTVENTAPKTTSHVSASGKGGAILSAAQGQVGEYQDCTQLVSDSLAAVGINFHGWPADYKSLGRSVSAAEAQAGDIAYYANGGSGMAHVAIYAGNGEAIHGGWNGNRTVKTSAYVGSGPEFIRVG
ncbi:hypothetical protein CWC38_03235 [Kocuria tytonicola]|uniref:NlpC/P60 domain-containing protein n=1 Tax=Kocuria tytonicola TaxID=2055946 RepID=A0A3L9L5G5_9MICC|nr:NlpC/P60 family protein [Kocuria tytonicola]RLY92187.1 hypothetical protein EAE32_08465 [Kocuria tytonicola]RLZ03895.1 hypothetical protein CWC38_03235 [Kocuria tytonicola]